MSALGSSTGGSHQQHTPDVPMTPATSTAAAASGPVDATRDGSQSTASMDTGNPPGSSAAGTAAAGEKSSSSASSAVAASSSAAIAAPAPVGRATSDRMIIKLTTNLMNTYNAINEKYYANKKKRLLEQEQAARALKAKQGLSAGASSSGVSVYNDGHDDKDFNYIVQSHELLANRYVVDHSIGKGSFGRVVKAFDTLSKKYVAIKIIKSKSAFYKQAQIELKILNSLQADADKWNIVTVIDQFMHHSHQCIVFELLSLNLYELLRNTRFTGVSLKLIAKFGQQLLITLGHLGSKERGEKRIIHCDLKPENILLRSCKKSAIKVIDFGSACFSNQKTYTYIQSRFYRAPEVLLGLSYNGSIDMWSLGCILVEMHTGKPLFDGQDEADQMVKQVEILGVPPRHMIEHNKKAEKFFEISQSTGHFRLKRKFSPNLGGSLRRALEPKWDDESELYKQFEDLISKMLLYDPLLRIRPAQALQHPFFGLVADSLLKFLPYGTGPDQAVASSAAGAQLMSPSGNPIGTGSGVATGLQDASAAAAASNMDTSSPRSHQLSTGASGAPSSHATTSSKADGMSDDPNAAAQAHKLALMHQQQLLHHQQQQQHHHHDRYAAQHNPRKRPHSNPLFGGQAGPMPNLNYGHGIQPLDPMVQAAIAAQSKQQTKKQTTQASQQTQQPVQRHNNLMQDGSAAAVDAPASATAAAASADDKSASAAAPASSGSQMEDLPDQSSTVVAAAAANPQTPGRAHAMVTRSTARGGDGAPSSAASLSVKRDSLDIAGLQVNPVSAASSANSSSRSSPVETDGAAAASGSASAAASSHLAVAADSRSRGNSQLSATVAAPHLVDASTATTANASATSSPKPALPAAPFSATTLALPDAAAGANQAGAAAHSMVDVDTDEQAGKTAEGDGASAAQSTPGKGKSAAASSGSSGKRGKRGGKKAPSSASSTSAPQYESESEGGASSSQLSRMSLDLDATPADADVVGRRTRSHAANQ